MVWPHWQGLGAMSRRGRLGSRLIVVVLILAASVYGSLWAYVECAAHRARSMLAAASRIRVGDTEASVLPLVERFGGYEWTPEQLSPREEWIDKDEYDYQKQLLSDYKYELGVSPFATTALRVTRLTQVMTAARKAVPTHLRSALGMRDWGTEVELSIRNNRVQSVSAMTLVEGHSEWLGHRWQIAEGMPRHDIRPRAYLIGAGNLTMEDGGGTMIENFFTPRASDEEVEAARKFNAACLTSVRGCNRLCDFAPSALEYLERHPDAAWNIIPPKCH